MPERKTLSCEFVESHAGKIKTDFWNMFPRNFEEILYDFWLFGGSAVCGINRSSLQMPLIVFMNVWSVSEPMLVGLNDVKPWEKTV